MIGSADQYLMEDAYRKCVSILESMIRQSGIREFDCGFRTVREVFRHVPSPCCTLLSLRTYSKILAVTSTASPASSHAVVFTTNLAA